MGFITSRWRSHVEAIRQEHVYVKILYGITVFLFLYTLLHALAFMEAFPWPSNKLIVWLSIPHITFFCETQHPSAALLMLLIHLSLTLFATALVIFFMYGYAKAISYTEIKSFVKIYFIFITIWFVSVLLCALFAGSFLLLARGLPEFRVLNPCGVPMWKITPIILSLFLLTIFVKKFHPNQALLYGCIYYTLTLSTNLYAVLFIALVFS